MRIRKPRLRITKNGLRTTKPSISIGGFNFSSKGVSHTSRTKFGSYNTRRGCSLPVGLLSILALLILAACNASTDTPPSRLVEIPLATVTTQPSPTPESTNTPSPTNTLQPSPTIPQPTPTITFTPGPTFTATQTRLPTDTPTATAIILTTGKIVITTIFVNGTGDKEPDEYVEIKNTDTFPIQLKGWSLSDKADHTFSFPTFLIQPGQTCRIYTNESHPETCGFSYRQTGSAIWNNGGDTATLQDSTGIIITTYGY